MLWTSGRKDKALAARFVAAVNAHDADALSAVVTPGFTYIDSWREGVIGRDAVVGAAKTLFALDRGFGIEVESVSYSEPYVLLRGWANSANPDFGRRRAVWWARCEGGKLAEWQSWAEGGPPAMTRTYAPDQAVDLSARTAEHPG